MKTRKLLVTVAIVFAIAISFVLGATTKPFKEAKASIFENSSLKMTRYEKVYCYGHEFIVFSDQSGSDIEVVMIN